MIKQHHVLLVLCVPLLTGCASIFLRLHGVPEAIIQAYDDKLIESRAMHRSAQLENEDITVSRCSLGSDTYYSIDRRCSDCANYRSVYLDHAGHEVGMYWSTGDAGGAGTGIAAHAELHCTPIRQDRIGG